MKFEVGLWEYLTSECNNG